MRQETAKKMQAALCRAVDAGEMAGVSLLILKDGEEQVYCEAGYADIEKEQKLQRDHIFRLYSMTKPLTAAAVMLLMERGEIDLAQPVSDFLPGFLNQQAVGENGELRPVIRPSTIRDLLNMTAGLVYLGDETAAERETTKVFEDTEKRMYGDTPVTTMELANRIGRCPLRWQPGEIWQYSSGADVLGAVVEAASGRRFGEFLREEFFEPLEMKDTAFYVPEEKQARLARAYRQNEQGRLVPYEGCNLAIMNDMRIPNAFESGGAGLVSTIDDYANFARMLLAGGVFKGKRILAERTVQFLTNGSVSEQQRKGIELWTAMAGYTYGNLMRVMKEPGRAMSLGSEGEYGWDGWEGCYFANCPKEKLTILLMMQKTDSGVAPVVRRIRNLLFADESLTEQL